jgi:dTDP-4-dehydrorhamnose reductase
MKKAKRLLVTGSSGMLGSNIIAEIGNQYETFGLDRRSADLDLKDQFVVDINDFAKTRDILSGLDLDCLIHCAAITNVERCEDDYNLAHKTNALATGNLADSISASAKFIYISTDSVFDGKNGNYRESDKPGPLNNYARTKLEAESLLEQGCKNHIIVRTNIFGWNLVAGESFAEWVVNSLRQAKPISMFTDVIFSPISVMSLAHYLGELIVSEFTGKINIVSADSISKYDFGLAVAQLFGFDASLISPMSIRDYPFKAPRPANTSLDVSKAKSIFGSMPLAMQEIEKFYCRRKAGGAN